MQEVKYVIFYTNVSRSTFSLIMRSINQYSFLASVQLALISVFVVLRISGLLNLGEYSIFGLVLVDCLPDEARESELDVSHKRGV